MEKITDSDIDELGFGEPCMNGARWLEIGIKNIGGIYDPIKKNRFWRKNPYSFGWYSKKGWVWHDVSTVEKLKSLIEQAKKEYAV